MKYLISGSVLIGSLLLAGSTALAAEQSQQGPWGGAGSQGRGPMQGLMMRDGHASTTKSGVAGIVGSISGNTLTVNSLTRKTGSDKSVSTTTYTIDATNATIFKGNATSTISSIAVGDLVIVQGAINGTSVTATKIMDGMRGRPEMGDARDDKKLHMASTTPRGKMDLMTGNGQPVIAGNVTVVSGNTITVTNKGGVTYTVDATNAKISKHGVTNATASDVAVGDSVVVQGTFNGTSVTATLVVDQGVRPALNVNNQSSGGNGNNKDQDEHRGFGAAVGAFFSHMFGF